ncbi:hypothetical protein TPHV1_130009 [Treponema phagedenis]|uniref:Uncharacterized protein n=1 Tax=Treponema phagedenis TaxID=162 RepID=A0A0B7GWF5_TREPH|nr:hypothetical protein TPHV1_130009 [Treponema phagedenis]
MQVHKLDSFMSSSIIGMWLAVLPACERL